ncbi:hypothetical protein AKJ40_04835 [candidate division MSBL1 archaeon SCGC-AAA259M10]|uniref:Uncharacterized protein n=2 Tax=candidate division MSBL1 TaxID=215777 RepID=A0A133V0W1_9EURY|nr:hypothetical protein AKJ40_04835 [candidate division MSBL1 archaeon SCGC-AAA259M10]KXB00084.1 hypothetical protein AKJ41_04395 [candidate division MSBL1 archaeon SCGC-AAA259O05]
MFRFSINQDWEAVLAPEDYEGSRDLIKKGKGSRRSPNPPLRKKCLCENSKKKSGSRTSG